MTAKNIIPQSPHFCKPFLQKSMGKFAGAQKSSAETPIGASALPICYKDVFVKLLQLALGLHALVVVQDLLTDTQILRGDLQQLVLC